MADTRVFHSDFGMGGDLSPPSGGGTHGGGQILDGGGFARDSRHFLENLKFEQIHEFQALFSSLDI